MARTAESQEAAIDVLAEASDHIAEGKDLLNAVDKLTEALDPVLEAGLPSPEDYRNWPSWLKGRKMAYETLHNALQDFSIGDLQDVAQELFGYENSSARDLGQREQAAVSKIKVPVSVSVEDFDKEIKETILRALAYQILRSYWIKKSYRPDYDQAGRRNILSIFYGVAYGAVVALVILSAFTRGPSSSFRVAVGILGLICIAAAIAVGYIARRRRSHQRRRFPLHAPLPPPDPQSVIQWQEEATKRLGQSKSAVPPLVEMILNPSYFRMRTVESISLASRNITQRVSIDFSFTDVRWLLPSAFGSPGDNSDSTEQRTAKIPQFLYIPLLIPRKGKLMDRLEITRSDGRFTSALSYEQSLRVLSLGLRYLIIAALIRPKKKPHLDDPDAPVLNSAEFHMAELKLLMQIARRGPIIREDSEGNETKSWKELKLQVEGQLKLIKDLCDKANPGESLEDRAERDKAMRHVEDYVLMLAYSYPIIVALPNTDPQPRRRLNYERIMVPVPEVDVDARHRFWLWQAIARRRLWLGLRPDNAQIPVNLAFNTDSYHLEVMAPADYYVRDQFVGCKKCKRRLHSDWRFTHDASSLCRHAPNGLDDKCYLRVGKRRGQNYSHIYMRGFDKTQLDSENMVTRVQFSETPPDIAERALLSAATASIAFGLLGYIWSHGLPHPSEFVSVFLALPGVAAAWFGYNANVDTVLRSSLGPRLSLWLTGALSLAGLICYLLQSFPGVNLGQEWSFLGIHQDLWLILLLLSLGNTAFIGYVSATRLLRFVRLSARTAADEPDPSGEVPSRRKEDRQIPDEPYYWKRSYYPVPPVEETIRLTSRSTVTLDRKPKDVWRLVERTFTSIEDDEEFKNKAADKLKPQWWKELVRYQDS